MQKIKKYLHDRLSHVVLILAWFWGYYIFRIRNKVTILGKENLPHDTRVLYVSHHLTLIDSFLIGISVISFWELLFYPKRICWNTPDASNFLTHRVWKHLFRLLKNVPVDRKSTSPKAIKHQIGLFVEALENSNLVLFFAGTRSRNGQVGDCVSGVSETVREAQPKYVIPIFLEGIEDIMPIHAGFSYGAISGFHKGKIVIGKSIDFSDLDMSDRHSRKQIGIRIKESVVDLKARRE